MRRSSDTEVRTKDAGRSVHAWAAVILLLSAIVLAAWLVGRDTDWEERSAAERESGLSTLANYRFPEAKVHFETALGINPYDWATHLSLAQVLSRHLNDNAGALKHYLLALAYAPEDADLKPLTDQVDILSLIRSGFMEDPTDAVEDMFMAVEAGVKSAFYRRLSPRLRGDFAAYWEAWNLRGRGKVVFRRIAREGGDYDALLAIAFADQTTMSMHFHCIARESWRLDVSFP